MTIVTDKTRTVKKLQKQIDDIQYLEAVKVLDYNTDYARLEMNNGKIYEITASEHFFEKADYSNLLHEVLWHMYPEVMKDLAGADDGEYYVKEYIASVSAADVLRFANEKRNWKEEEETGD